MTVYEDLCEAADAGRVDSVKSLMTIVCNRDNIYKRPSMFEVLRAAIAGGNIEIVSILVNNESIDVDEQALDGRTVISEAVVSGNVEIVRCILKQSPVALDTARDVAIRAEYWEIAKLLEEKGAANDSADAEA